MTVPQRVTDAGPGNSIEAALDAVRQAAAVTTGGELADYIPELALADPALFGIALVSMSGHVYESGRSRDLFSVQSISKPLVYALVIDRIGLDAVHAVVGSEPSGEAFNAISFDDAGHPRNPMINAGAIATTALLPADSAAGRFDRILSGLSGFAGRALDVDEVVFTSEKDTAHRNRGLAHLMAAAGVLTGDPDTAVDDYVQQCSIRVSTVDLAVAAATLAGGGVNPVSGERVVSAEAARHALSMMASCGMYDRAGEWMLRVGLPAKSGVSGGIIAATPGRMGLGVFSPPLDPAGNSLRGVLALTELSERYGLHMLNLPRQTHPFQVETTDGSVNIRVRGDIDFVAAETLIRRLEEDAAAGEITSILVDLTGASGIAPIAMELLRGELGFLEGTRIEFVHPE